MKTISQAFLTGAVLFISLNLQAQSSFSSQAISVGTVDSTPIQSISDVPAQSDSIVCVTAEAQGLQRMTLENLPVIGGTYWWVLSEGSIVPTPFPQDVNNPIYQITPGIYLEDTTGGQVPMRRRGLHGATMSVTEALAAEAQTVVNLIQYVQTPPVEPPAAPMMRMSMMASSLASTYAYGNPVYLTNLTTSLAYDGSTTANFSIGGGTNFVPYDILTTTNLAAPISTWNWLGIGYTSNNYNFYEQPSNLGFYILAKPSKTMTVGWGQDNHTQSDVPWGTTNAVMVAGSYYQGLALLADGTVEPWGDNYYTSQPTNLTGIAMVACGLNHNVALRTNGTVVAWGYNLFGELNVPSNLTNVTVISSQGYNTLALCSNGTVVVWGDNTYGQTNIPAGLANVTAIACGGQHNLAVSNGMVVAWGDNGSGQCVVPLGLSNVWDVAAGWAHSVALKTDGTIVCWGDNSSGECTVPVGLSNVVAIAAGGYISPFTGYTMALKKDGSVVTFGKNQVATSLGGLNHVIAIGGGYDYGFAIRSGPPTPVITLEPVDQYQAQGSNATFTATGQGLYGVTYQWQTNGVNLAGATNTALTVTNVQATTPTNFDVVVTDNAGMGSITSSVAKLYMITPPIITYQSAPTNIVCIYGNHVAFAATAYAPGMTNGFPLSYHWQLNGTNISGATSNAYDFYAADNLAGTYTFVAANAAGSASVSWQVALTNAINVTNDLLLIYNTNSADSTFVKDYYLAHRPNVAGANVLGISCSNNEVIPPDYCTNIMLPQITTWLTNNPTKRPQYVVLFYDIPSRVNTNAAQGDPSLANWPSVQYQIRYGCLSGWNPFVTSINMGSTNDCIAYINKLAYIGTNYSPGQLIISAGAYGNTNYIIDDVTDLYCGSSYLPVVTNGLLSAGVPQAAIHYLAGCESMTSMPHLTNSINVAGYITWGQHSSLGGGYPENGKVKWSGNSGWWVMRSEESFNGQREASGQGNFTKWFTSTSFGGTNYSNTPLGGPTYTDEPGAGATDNSIFFSSWAGGKNLAICAWSSIGTIFYQVLGDPLVVK